MAVNLALREKLAEALEADLKSLAELRKGLDEERHAVANLSWTKQASGVAIGSGLICLTLVGGGMFSEMFAGGSSKSPRRARAACPWERS